MGDFTRRNSIFYHKAMDCRDGARTANKDILNQIESAVQQLKNDPFGPAGQNVTRIDQIVRDLTTLRANYTVIDFVQDL